MPRGSARTRPGTPTSPVRAAGPSPLAWPPCSTRASARSPIGLIGNAVVALRDHAEELLRVRAAGNSTRSLVPELIEEVLRHSSPIQSVFRKTTQAVELAGETIPSGALVLALLGSANRDE